MSRRSNGCEESRLINPSHEINHSNYMYLLYQAKCYETSKNRNDESARFLDHIPKTACKEESTLSAKYPVTTLSKVHQNMLICEKVPKKKLISLQKHIHKIASERGIMLNMNLLNFNQAGHINVVIIAEQIVTQVFIDLEHLEEYQRRCLNKSVQQCLSFRKFRKRTKPHIVDFKDGMEMSITPSASDTVKTEYQSEYNIRSNADSEVNADVEPCRDSFNNEVSTERFGIQDITEMITTEANEGVKKTQEALSLTTEESVGICSIQFDSVEVERQGTRKMPYQRRWFEEKGLVHWPKNNKNVNVSYPETTAIYSNAFLSVSDNAKQSINLRSSSNVYAPQDFLSECQSTKNRKEHSVVEPGTITDGFESMREQLSGTRYCDETESEKETRPQPHLDFKDIHDTQGGAFASETLHNPINQPDGIIYIKCTDGCKERVSSWLNELAENVSPSGVMIDRELISCIQNGELRCLKVGCPLGKGGFGEVILCEAIGMLNQRNLIHVQFVAKWIRREKFNKAEVTFNMTLAETVPGILRFFGVTVNGSYVTVFQEYFPGHTLRDILKTLNLDDVTQIFYKLLKIVEMLHGKRVVHWDIKASNIMVQRDGKGNFDVKLIDFGSAKHLDCPYELKDLKNGTEYSPDLRKIKRKPSEDEMTGQDSYCLGLVFEKMLEKSGTIMAEHDGLNGEQTQSTRAILLMALLVKSEPEKRINVPTALQHPFFNGIRNK